jgi:hypothetical protein
LLRGRARRACRFAPRSPEPRLQQRQRPRLPVGRRFLERAIERLRVVLGRIAAGQEELLHRLVAAQEQQRADRALAVAAGAARLLVVGLQSGRHLVVQHEADVRLVDAQPERIGRHHHPVLAAHERFLRRVPLGRRQSAVVQAHGFTARRQRLVDLLRRLDRGGVDQAGSFAGLDQGHGPQQLVGFARHLLDAQVEVGPVRTGVDDAVRGDAQLLADVAGDVVGGRGRQRQHRRPTQALARRSDLQERGAEVVAPLRDAMRLVDDEQAHRVRLQQRQELGIGESLRRRHHDPGGAVRHGGLRRLLLVAAHGAVQLHGVDAERLQRLALIFHQCNQRRHDHRAARQHDGGQLVAQRLAGAGGHDGQRRFAGERAIDHRPLSGAQARQPEYVAQGGAGAAPKGRGAFTAGGHQRASASSSRSSSGSSASMSVNSCASTSVRGKPSPVPGPSTRSGMMSPPSSNESCATEARSPVPAASLSACASCVPMVSLPVSELSLGPSTSELRPLGCSGASSAPRMLL